jgi:two-component system OmpR family sensor kinase
LSRLGARLARIPLRRRLVAGFVITMLVLLTGSSAFVYWRVQTALDESLDGDLRGAADSLEPQVSPAGTLPAGIDDLSRIDGYQIVAADGRVVDHAGVLTGASALPDRVLATALTRPSYHDVGEILQVSRPTLRLYAEPLRDSSRVLVVALRRDQRDEALRELAVQLLVAGVVALGLASLVGDALARAALRPVETYRSQARQIAAGATGVRLEVPQGRDDEITRLGNTLNEMLESLEEAVDRERRFVNDASHELRTPLTLLTSRVQLTLRRPRNVAEHEAALEEIATDLDRLTHLADQLLELGVAQHPAGEVHHGDLAASAVKAVAARTTLAAPGTPYAAPGALTVAATPPVPVGLDDVTLTRIVDNVLENAAGHGGPPVAVTVDIVDGLARLRVTDAGPGMEADLLHRATERFARSADARVRRGSGLGLALVASLVESAGGQLRLCHGGHHVRIGHSFESPCDHGDQMTVSALLPLLPE